MKPTAPREPTVPIAVRAPEAIVERLDALAAAMSTPWHQATRRRSSADSDRSRPRSRRSAGSAGGVVAATLTNDGENVPIYEDVPINIMMKGPPCLPMPRFRMAVWTAEEIEEMLRPSVTFEHSGRRCVVFLGPITGTSPLDAGGHRATLCAGTGKSRSAAPR